MKFDDFVAGPNNTLAFRACETIAKTPGTYNPLYLYGGTGSGKTHLLKGIEWEVDRQSCKYLQGFEFVQEMATALKAGELDVWRDDLRQYQWVLFDDIGPIMESDATVTEFFLFVESMLTVGKQLVLTADRKPREFENISDKLISRLCWGLNAELGPLTEDERLQILKQEINKKELGILEEDITFMLQHLPGGVRELQGAVVQLAAHRDLNDEDPDRKTIVKVLQGAMSMRKVVKRTSIDEILEEVSAFYQVRIQDILSARRTKILADPRHIAIWIARELTGLTLTEIGARFGGRDHSTILHAVNKIKGIRMKDLRRKTEIDGLMAQLTMPVTV